MRCSRCNAEIPEGKRFCPECFWDSRPGQESQPTRTSNPAQTSNPARNRERQFSIFHPLTFQFFAIALMISYFQPLIINFRSRLHLDDSLVHPLDTIYLVGTILIGLAIFLAAILKLHQKSKYLGWLGIALFGIGSIGILVLFPINYFFIQVGMIVLFAGLALTAIQCNLEDKHAWKTGLFGLLFGKIVVTIAMSGFLNLSYNAFKGTVLSFIIMSLVTQTLSVILSRQSQFDNTQESGSHLLNGVLLAIGLGIIYITRCCK